MEPKQGRLAGKTAVITGSTSGMGAATAEMYVAEGARVMITGRREDAGQEMVDRLGENAAFTAADVTKESDVAALVDATVQRWGRVDILFNNAGYGREYTLVEEFNPDEFLQDIWTLVGACFLTAKYVSPIMKAQGSGSIINNGSTGGITTDGSSAVYSACKAGMIHVTKVWATELIGHGVRVNCITPGAITTPIFWGGANTQSEEENEARRERLDRWWVENRPQGRPGMPDDIAYAAVYLGSDESQYVSGHNLVVDAAHTATRMAFEELNAMKAARSKVIEGT
jgi:NAD(P)-dependent dehydrogenase (short-subunit alcohol dehydrogenase family)